MYPSKLHEIPGFIHLSLLTSKHNEYRIFTILSGYLAEFQMDFYTYRVIDRARQRLMDQQVRTDSLERCNETDIQLKFLEFIVWKEQMEHIQLGLTGFVYGCFFVCDWHLQMVFASSEALMAVVHHGACVSRRCWDKCSPTQVNDQSLQRK